MVIPCNILITGASSGIGAALAVEYAAAGVTLYILGRDSERLRLVANACRAKGAEVRSATIDVTDAPAMAAYIEKVDDAQPLDLVIANAGISSGSFAGVETTVAAQMVFDVNVQGVLNTIHPILPRMVARGAGQLALMASLASMRPLPSAPAYSASKAAVRFYGEALRGLLHKKGVRVNVICPGWIETPLTSCNDFSMPLMMSPERAANIIACGLRANKPRIAFPRTLYFPLWLLSCLHHCVSDFIFNRMPGKAQKI
ncbi:MAG: SDR family NAD(P)-dependent oxidoreductase [Rickettsiales bacterium]